eukprot:Opistho-2@73945
MSSSLRAFIVLEAVVSLGSGVFMALAPRLALQQMMPPHRHLLITPVAEAAVAWFSAMVCMSAYQLFRSLYIADASQAHAVRRVVTETFLLGDILYLLAFVPFVQYGGGGEWNPATLFAAGITVFLALGRAFFLATELTLQAPQQQQQSGRGLAKRK